jgi:hypothetical protein
MHRLQVLNACDAFIRAPAQKGASGSRVGSAGVFVADIDREEFEEALAAFSPALMMSTGSAGPRGLACASSTIMAETIRV